MKRKTIIRTILFSALLTVGALIYKNASAQTEAANCAFTGSSSDHCNASDGKRNLKVLNCSPGETSCSFD
jgi:hypothetical protein